MPISSSRPAPWRPSLPAAALLVLATWAGTPVSAAPVTVDAGAFQATYDTSRFLGGYGVFQLNQFIAAETSPSSAFSVTTGADSLVVSLGADAVKGLISPYYRYEGTFSLPLTLLADRPADTLFQIEVSTTLSGVAPQQAIAPITGTLSAKDSTGAATTLAQLNLIYPLSGATPPLTSVLKGTFSAAQGLSELRLNLTLPGGFTPRTSPAPTLSVNSFTIKAVSAVPEPAQAGLFALGMVALGLMRRARSH